MATTWSEDGSKKETKNTNRGHVAHLRKEGKAHSGGPEHDFMHGRRGTKTWPDGRRKYDKDGNLIIGKG